uniref:Uncharacterized protein n=1 Tax=Rhizophora mucronata TaxID=61149 RepID=A0A2P2QSK5_RHIMU
MFLIEIRYLLALLFCFYFLAIKLMYFLYLADVNLLFCTSDWHWTGTLQQSVFLVLWQYLLKTNGHYLFLL